MSDIQIYVADLAAYNNGKLHGVWVDMCQELDDIWKAIKTMLADSPEGFAEEYAIHDYEGFGSYRIGEYEGVEAVHAAACFIEAYPDFGAELLSYYSDMEEAKKMAEDNYQGCFKSLSDYAEDFMEQTAEIPENLAFYIDYQKMGRDWELSGDIFTLETGFEELHVFWNH